jgi:hypothetical protein
MYCIVSPEVAEVLSESSWTIIVVTASVKEDERGGQGLWVQTLNTNFIEICLHRNILCEIVNVRELDKKRCQMEMLM